MKIGIEIACRFLLKTLYWLMSLVGSDIGTKFFITLAHAGIFDDPFKVDFTPLSPCCFCALYCGTERWRGNHPISKNQ